MVNRSKKVKIHFLLLLAFLCSLKLCYSQEKSKSKLALMQGVWENTMNSESEKAFTIIKGNLSLSFVYNISAGLDFPLTELVEGFYDGDVEEDSLNVNTLKEDGAHYVVVDKNDIKSGGWVYNPYYLVPRYFDCDGEIMSINGGQLAEYVKIDELPFEALTKLYNRGEIDKRDYIKEYLSLNALSITKSQSSEHSKGKLLQGIWAGVMNSDSTEYLYKIISVNRSLGISFTNTSQASDFYLNESIEGFQNYDRNEVDSINVKWLSEIGKYYTVIFNEDQIDKSGWVSTEYCITAEYFECDGERLSINGGHLSEFDKIESLPFNAISLLHKRGKLDKRDYIKEYLKLKTQQVKPLKCKVYLNPNGQSKVQLKKDDVVIIIEETSKWVKVRYSQDGLGWIKEGDLNCSDY